MTLRVWLPAQRAGSGADVFTRRLAEGLRRSGADAQVTWLHPFYEFVPGLIPVHPPAGTQLVHANTWNGFVFAKARLPLVLSSLHSVMDPDWLGRCSAAQRLYYRFRIHPLEKRSFRVATAVTAISEHTRRIIQSLYGLRDVPVIYPWIDTDVFKPGPRAARAPGPFRLLFVGNLIRRKGADLLPEILRRLGGDFELTFTGGLRGPAAYKALPPNMVHAGRIEGEAGMAALYNRCDAVLFPTRLEGFGYAPVEAQACGKPVVATNISSIPEVVRDGVTGLLCPVDDVDAFVAACRRLAAETTLYGRLAGSARQHVLNHFTRERSINAHLALYRDVLARR